MLYQIQVLSIKIPDLTRNAECEKLVWLAEPKCLYGTMLSRVEGHTTVERRRIYRAAYGANFDRLM